MRNVVIHQNKTEAIGKLWKTHLFQDAWRDSRRGGLQLDWIMNTIKDSDMPHITYEADLSEERFHFTSWMGLVQLRDEYTNPYISDLYYLHELMHVHSMSHKPCERNGKFCPAKFHRRMSVNELFVATYTEAQIYNDVQGLREKTFDFEIWYDTCDTIKVSKSVRTMVEEAYKEISDQTMMFNASLILHSDWMQEMIEKRVQAITTPRIWERNDLLISKYASSNLKWSDLWKDDAADLMCMVQEMKNGSLEPEAYIKWLTETNGQQINFIGENGVKAVVVPFYRHAVSFDKIARS